MCELEKEIIKLGAIDAPIDGLCINDWFDTVKITFTRNGGLGKAACTFKKCFDISFKHDENYTKIINDDGNPDYKYFIQNIEIERDEDLYCFTISAWPLEGKILCEEIRISVE